ncbi:putative F-box protein At1g49610 [Ziziphus jujuba]|uniref:F-box protein At1g49610 n=1 Tax=Ziziphus jujuba TaxID=326968 RepID=A0A6P3Z837_ZIZJJ|nr:putative F-box protein At1g49610 [Ziziphus jujuba]
MMENALQRCGSVLQNKKNKREGEEEKEDDRISELPDDILARIVSGLPLKEAVATSVLAKRWRYIWTFTKNLDFDAEETLNRIIESPGQLLRVERPKYIDRVNSVIAQRSSKNNMVRGIDRFRIGFDLCREFSSSIDNWIEFAMKNRVKTLELEFFEYGGLRMNCDCYILRKKHFDPVALKSLKVLNLTSVEIHGRVVEWLLSKCPLLERLKVAGSDKLINLRISGVPNLKHFEIRRCINIKKVEICAAQNLVSLYSLSTYPYEFILRNVPKLVDLHIDTDFGSDNDEDLGLTFTLLSSCLSQLQILHLDLLLQPHVWNLEYPRLTNLKHLKLTLSATENLNLLLSRIIPFLKVSPCLQRLELMMLLEKYFDEKCGFVKQPTNCPVKEVEILGYSGRKNLDQLIIYFADNLVALQKIVVHPCASAHEKFNFDPAFRRIKNSKIIKEEEKIRDHAMQHIKGKIPTAVEFVCL